MKKDSKQKDGKKRSRVPAAKTNAAKIAKLRALRAQQGAAQSGMPPPSAFEPASDLRDITNANDPDPLPEGVECRPDVTFVVDFGSAPVVDLSHGNHAATQGATMVLTLKGTSRNGKRAIYTGALISVTIGLGAFPDKAAPANIEVADGVFAPARAAKTPRVKLTDAEKAAAREARKNAPKPTLAEKIARREAQLAKDKAKLAAASEM